eukprot:1163235-Prorocentrum_minimum.AAC.2
MRAQTNTCFDFLQHLRNLLVGEVAQLPMDHELLPRSHDDGAIYSHSNDIIYETNLQLPQSSHIVHFGTNTSASGPTPEAP